MEEFLARWDGRRPVVAIPTTFPGWHVDDAREAGLSAIMYANQGLRASVFAVRAVFHAIAERGSADIDLDQASLGEIFELQCLPEWQEVPK